jgi:hypothetical protein
MESLDEEGGRWSEQGRGRVIKHIKPNILMNYKRKRR